MINVREKTKQQTKNAAKRYSINFLLKNLFVKVKNTAYYENVRKKPKYEAKIKQDITANHL